MPAQLTLKTDDLRQIDLERQGELKAFIRRMDPNLDANMIQAITFKWELEHAGADISVRSLIIDPPPGDPHLTAVIRRYLTDLPTPPWLAGLARP